MAEAGETGRVSEWVDSLYDGREKLSHYGRAYLAMTLDLLSPSDDRIQHPAGRPEQRRHPERHRRALGRGLLRLVGDEHRYPLHGHHPGRAEQARPRQRADPQRGALADGRPPGRHLGDDAGDRLGADRPDRLDGRHRRAGRPVYYGVSLNGDVLARGQVTPDNVDQSIKLRVDVAELLADVANYLTVSRGEGPGRLYYTAHLKVYLPVEEIEPLNRGIIVHRQYVERRRACPQRTSRARRCTEAQVGDVIQVKLTHHRAARSVLRGRRGYAARRGRSHRHQPGRRPACWTATRRLRRQNERGEGWYEFYYWWWNWYSRSEMRDEKVVLFADYLPAGTYEYTYTFRAVLPGEYQVIPTFANEFYFPEVFGRGEGELFVITD